jgi:hypothetical protein
MKDETKIERRGGKRQFAGSIHKYGELTTNITIRVPISKKQEVRELVKNYLKEYINPINLRRNAKK